MDIKWFVVYRISNVFDSDTYIGCTFNTVAQRFNQHVSKSKTLDTRLSRKIRDVGKENMAIVDLVSRFMTLNDAREIERGLIKLLEPTLNMLHTSGFRSEDGSWDVTEYKRDYCFRNKEHKAEYDRDYYFKNKDKFSESISCDCGGRYTQRHKAQHKKTQRHLSNTSVFSASSIVNPEDSMHHCE